MLDDGRRLVDALLREDAFPHPVGELRRLETHGAWVLLTGDYAYKIKKPVDFGFLDYSTLEKRRFCCEEELRLNRRFAPDIYLDVVAIGGDRAEPRVNGQPVLEYAVRMRQFPDDGLLSQLAAQQQLQAQHVDQMVALVADFHRGAERAGPVDPWGDAGQVHHWVEENFLHIRPLLGDDENPAQLERVRRWTEQQRTRLEPVFAQRRQEGFIRECHGDLHLGNLTLIDGRVRLFDCIEFNPQLRWIDVMSEIAFLVMDLAESGYPEFSQRFVNGYLQDRGDYAGLRLLPYYLVYRALVRAKVAMLRRQQAGTASPDRDRATRDYANYLRFAEQVIDRPRPVLVLTHGVSGSGKSTVAQALCEARGMVQLRSDVERKRLAGLTAHQTSDSAVGAGLYTRSHGEATYARLLELAETVLQAGFAVLVDATFLEQAERARFRSLAQQLAVPFLILDCVAPDAVLRERVHRRQDAQTDVSEATLEVLEAQQRSLRDLSQEEQACALRVDTGRPDWREQLLADTEQRLPRA